MEVKAMLQEREGRYGSFELNAEVMQGIKQQMENSPNWDKLPPHMKEAMQMLAHKIGRVLGGDPYYIDNWVDIAGYAQLVIDILRRYGDIADIPDMGESCAMYAVDNVNAA